MAKIQRILDPIHGLIRFDDSPEEQLIWRLIDSPEFQRLRRIKQLGVSEFVYPGATHTRFSHSLGVFHNARRLLEIVRREINAHDDGQDFAVLCAALLHDLGHGPFSHVFEKIEKKRETEKEHEDWTCEIIESDTSVNSILREVSDDFPAQVAKLIRKSEGGDIYSSVVSSQFDADRLDYLVRDKYMTGIGSGAFDQEWLLDCLKVGNITVGHKEDFQEVPSFYLSYKGYKAAESYLQARFQLYSMVYMHKTTRAAECMLKALLIYLSQILIETRPEELSILPQNALIRYLQSTENTLGEYLQLDDNVVWASLYEFSSSRDQYISDMATRFLNRALFKCFDVGVRVAMNTHEEVKIKKAINDNASALGLDLDLTLLRDDSKLSGYAWYDWDSENALKRVLVDGSEQKGNPEDIAASSEIVKALMKTRFYRIYVPDDESRDAVEKMIRKVMT